METYTIIYIGYALSILIIAVIIVAITLRKENKKTIRFDDTLTKSVFFKALDLHSKWLDYKIEKLKFPAGEPEPKGETIHGECKESNSSIDLLAQRLEHAKERLERYNNWMLKNLSFKEKIESKEDQIYAEVNQIYDLKDEVEKYFTEINRLYKELLDMKLKADTKPAPKTTHELQFIDKDDSLHNPDESLVELRTEDGYKIASTLKELALTDKESKEIADEIIHGTGQDEKISIMNITKICAKCGKAFTPNGPRQKFCSKKCGYKPKSEKDKQRQKTRKENKSKLSEFDKNLKKAGQEVKKAVSQIEKYNERKQKSQEMKGRKIEAKASTGDKQIIIPQHRDYEPEPRKNKYTDMK